MKEDAILYKFHMQFLLLCVSPTILFKSFPQKSAHCHLILKLRMRKNLTSVTIHQCYEDLITINSLWPKRGSSPQECKAYALIMLNTSFLVVSRLISGQYFYSISGKAHSPSVGSHFFLSLILCPFLSFLH